MLKLALISLAEDKEHSPVNMSYLATYVQKHLGKKIGIKIIDANFDNIPKEIAEYKPEIIGISSMTIHYETAKKLAALIKRYLKVPILLGGVHISTCPESLTKEFDVAVIGEGEKTLLELMKLYLKENEFQKNKLQKIPNLVFYSEGKIEFTPRGLVTKNIDEFPIPRRDFFNSAYFKPKLFNDLNIKEKSVRTELVTSRGCPYRCIFCSTSHFWENIRLHSPKRIVEEMVYLNKDFGVNNFQITDDLFAFNKKRLLEIKNLMQKKGLLGKVKLFCQIRGNLVDEELLDILKSMNVVSVNLGLESGSNPILRKLKGENITVEQIKNAVLLAKKKGFDVHGSFMMASPGETKEDMLKTLKFMEELKYIGINECWCGVTTPLPKTKLWKETKVKRNIDWDTLDPNLPFEPYFLHESVEFKEFKKIFKKAKRISIEILKQNSKYRESKLLRLIKDTLFFNKGFNKAKFKIKKKIRFWKLEKEFKIYFE